MKITCAFSAEKNSKIDQVTVRGYQGTLDWDTITAVNWNKLETPYVKAFWDQNLRQFWVDTEIPLSQDKICWQNLPKEIKEVYKKVLAGLTLLDTQQGSIGMSRMVLTLRDDNPQIAAVLQFMGAMEQIHAKSYSTIFSSLCTTPEIKELFEWANTDPILHKKLNLILKYYHKPYVKEEIWQMCVASVMLESFLFYSGFFLPLYLAGQGKMINSAEIINLIIRDEAIHGSFVGMLSQEIWTQIAPTHELRLLAWINEFVTELMKLEEEYTRQVYGPLGEEIVNEVMKYIKYNCNKALQNIGFTPAYDVTDKNIHPFVFNGIKTGTRNHDFFSSKGNGYVKPTKIEKLSDEDFII